MSELSATTTGTQDAGRPVVGIVMGSDSDWPVMGAAAEVLDEFKVAYEADVVSAHRMPTEMIDYGRAAAERGLRVIIAGAGGSAHLPGMLAAVTELPVIGVPVPLKYLDGMDSLLSIVQMPAGIHRRGPQCRAAGGAYPRLRPGAGGRPPGRRHAGLPGRPQRGRPRQGRRPARAAAGLTINRLRDEREGRWLCQEPALKASCQNSSASQSAFIPRAFSGMR